MANMMKATDISERGSTTGTKESSLSEDGSGSPRLSQVDNGSAPHDDDGDVKDNDGDNDDDDENDYDDDYDEEYDQEMSHQSSGAGSGGGLSVSVSATRKIDTPSNLRTRDPNIRMIRIVVFLVLIAAGIIVSLFVYFAARKSETAEFELRWDDQSAHVTHAFVSETSSKLSNIDALAITLQSHAILNKGQIGATWPLFIIPDFSYRAASTMTNTMAESITLLPIVHSNDRKIWESYSVAQQFWRQDGLDFQERFPDALSTGSHDMAGDMGHRLLNEEEVMYRGNMTANMSTGTEDMVANETQYNAGESIAEFIWRVQDGKPIPDPQFGPYFPVWQHMPVHKGFSWVNFNKADVEIDNEAISAVLASNKAVIGKTWDLASSNQG
jgi:hypothetical protein